MRAVTPALAVLLAVPQPGGGSAQLLDRIVARVGATPILLSDVRAAVGLGLVDEARGPALPQIVDRQLLVAEIARFPLSEPPAGEVEEELARMRAHAGAALEPLMRSTGYDDRRLREVARDTVRIRGYLRQRFGAASIDDQDVQRWLRDTRTRAAVVITPDPDPSARPEAPPAR
jgi:hypothetical protein